mgnify:CR=1 FL=1
MGLNESYMAPGWYNNIALSLYTSNNCDIDAAESQAWSDINSRLNKMKNDSEYAINFFGNKILSQWNEPSYESIWVSKVKGHDVDVQEGLGKAVYDGNTGQFLELYFNFYMMAVFILFTLGIYFMFLYKKDKHFYGIAAACIARRIRLSLAFRRKIAVYTDIHCSSPPLCLICALHNS